jgi:uncharacterized damage-inducible protein DinB
MDINDVRTLFAYNLWANRRMFSVLEKLSDAQFMAEAQSSFPSIRESVFHILAAEWIWLKRWKGASPRASVANPNASARTWNGMTPSDKPAYEELASVAALRAFAELLEKERQQFLGSLSDAALQRHLDYTDMAGKAFSMPLVQLMQHVVNHGTYHRGQVTTLLRQVGGETVSLDMSFFFREEHEKAAQAS